jgi:hypothetical protein
VLVEIARHLAARIRGIATAAQFTERAVTSLETAGYITRRRTGWQRDIFK